MEEEKKLPEGAIMVGLDIGTTKISVIIGRKDQYGKLDIMWFFQWLKVCVDLEGQSIEFNKSKTKAIKRDT